jgi:hypothetical protein
MAFAHLMAWWIAAPVLVVIGLLLLMVLACYLTCWASRAWAWLRGVVGEKSLCDRLAELL